MTVFHEKSGFSLKRAQLYFICLMLVVATAFVYWNVDKSGFISFDDYDYIVNNYHISDREFDFSRASRHST